MPSSRRLLGLRATFFFLLLPCTAVGYVPFRILGALGRLASPEPTLPSLAASLFIVAGTAALLRSVWEFFRTGRGTLAPVDPPVVLVVGGLYRYTRNPMYNAVLVILLGQAWLFRSWALALYALGLLVVFHLFVVLYEERTLETRFGASYRAYAQAVPRWGFTRHPYAAASGGTA